MCNFIFVRLEPSKAAEEINILKSRMQAKHDSAKCMRSKIPKHQQLAVIQLKR